YKRALAMGAKTLRRKRLRLAVTIILCFISFAAFGFADVVVAFDAQKVASTALYESNDNYVSFNAYFGDGDDSGARGKVQDVVGLDCSSSDLQKIRQTMGLDFQGVINANANIVFWNEELLSDGSGKEYYKNYSKGSLPASKKLFDAMGFKLYGRLPNNQEELVITKHCFDQISLAGIQGKDDDLLPDEVVDIQDFLDKNFSIVCGNSIYKIVGVVDTFADADRALLNCQPDDVYALNWTLRKYFGYGYHSLTYIYQSLYDKCVEENTLGEDSSNFGKPLSVSIRGEDQNLSAKGAASGESLKNVDKVIWLDGNGDRKELAENEIVIGVGAADFLWSPKSDIYENRTLCDYSKTFFNGKVSFKEMSLLQLRNYGKIDIAYCMEAEEISLQELEIYKDFCLANNPNRSLFDKLRSSGYKVIDLNCDPNTMTEDDWRFSYACYLSSTKSLTVDFDNIDGGYYKNVTGRKSGEELEKKYANRIFVENRIENDLISAKWTAAKDYSINFSGFSQHRNEYANVQFDDVPKIVGIYFPKEGDPDNYLINDKIYIKGLDYEQALYKYLIAPLSGTAKTKEVTELITTLQYDTSELRTFYCNNPIYFETDWLTGTYYGIKNIVIVVSAVIGLFAILLLGNYMEQSISSKKKEIGILRSVGAKKSDVFAIFVNEGVIITAIILALAIMGVGFATLGFNLLAPMSSGLSFNLKVLNFGIRQIALLLLVGFGTTAVASAIPLYKLSKKKPVDSIQDR
ncbi:MAG: ABC transporter permease, partial [Clostridia bacterium]|nr:ABC transporter permease [Clostridia bacterium]